VACVAWPRKAELLAAAGVDSHEAGEALAANLLRNVLRGLGAEMADEPDVGSTFSGPKLLAMHAMVRDSVTSTGQPLVGCDFEIGIDDLALVGADAYLLGHVHMQQHWLIGSAPCIYPGSPRRTNFGETEAKGYVVLEFDDAGKLVAWDFVEVPATPMLHFNMAWLDGVMVIDSGRQPSEAEYLAIAGGAEVRLRYEVASDQREAARSAAAKMAGDMSTIGASLVKVEEEVRLEHRTRADSIAANATLEQKVEAFWAAKRFEPGERREALLAKLRQIEEARHAA
jgi:exonuclease SbcD